MFKVDAGAREKFAIEAMKSWIMVLTRRKDEPGYSDQLAAHEAARLAVDSADELIYFLEKERRDA